MLLAVLFFRSFYGSSEPGTPLHRDSIPSKPLRPHALTKFNIRASSSMQPETPRFRRRVGDNKPNAVETDRRSRRSGDGRGGCLKCPHPGQRRGPKTSASRQQLRPPKSPDLYFDRCVRVDSPGDAVAHLADTETRVLRRIRLPASGRHLRPWTAHQSCPPTMAIL